MSFDLLAAAFLATIYFTNYFSDETQLLRGLSFYFFGYAIVWFLTIVVSKKFPQNYLKLGQWILLLAIGLLITFGI